MLLPFRKHTEGKAKLANFLLNCGNGGLKDIRVVNTSHKCVCDIGEEIRDASYLASVCESSC